MSPAALPCRTGVAPNRAQALYENARSRGHTKKEARRILKRHLSDVIYRRMIRDVAQRAADHPLLAA